MPAINFKSISSEHYDSLYRRSGHFNGKEPDSKLIETAQTKLSPNADIADIGAGDGRNTVPLAKLGYNVDAFEFSDEGKKKIEERSENLQNVHIFDRNILYNPFKRKYDAAFMSHVSQHFSNNELGRVIKNVSESLKPDGLFVFDALINKNDDMPANALYDEANGCCHFPESIVREHAKDSGFEVKEIEPFSEGKESRGKYYCEQWGFAQDGIDYETSYIEPPRPVELKWITLQKKV